MKYSISVVKMIVQYVIQKRRESAVRCLATQMDGLRCETVEAGAAAQPRFHARASSLSDMLSLCGAGVTMAVGWQRRDQIRCNVNDAAVRRKRVLLQCFCSSRILQCRLVLQPEFTTASRSTPAAVVKGVRLVRALQ